MKNQKYAHADHIAIPAPTGGVTSGQAVRVGNLTGVAVTTAAAGERVGLWLDGSYTLDVNGALTVGQTVYIAANGSLTATAGSNTPFGTALEAKGTGTGPAHVAPFGNTPPAPAAG